MINKEVIKYIEKNQDEIVNFLSTLISFQSTNTGIPGQGRELELQNWLRDRFNEFGFDKVDYWAVDSEGKRPNVVGTIKGNDKGESLILNGHCDVVPVHEEEIKKWETDPWTAVVREGIMYGRGSSDMKSGLTAMIWAAKAIIDSKIKLKGDLFVESVVGEESGEGQTIGAKATVDRGYKAPFAIIGEPTNNDIQVRSPGIFFFELIIPGKEAHICDRNQAIYPQKHGVSSGSKVAVDAITKSIPFIQLFQRIEVDWNQRWQDELLPEEAGIATFTINPCYIEGGKYGAAVVPGYCKIVYNVRYPHWLKDEDLWEELKEHVNSLSLTDDWLKKNPPQFNVPIIRRWPPMRDVPKNHPGVQILASAYKHVTGKETCLTSFKGLADSTFLSQSGIPSVLFGPGSFNNNVHGPNEFVSIEQMIYYTKIYATMVLSWCG